MKKLISFPYPRTVDGDYITTETFCPISQQRIYPELYAAHGKKAFIKMPCCKQVFVKWHLRRWFNDHADCPHCRKKDAKYLLDEFKHAELVVRAENAPDPNTYLRRSENPFYQMLAELNDLK